MVPMLELILRGAIAALEVVAGPLETVPEVVPELEPELVVRVVETVVPKPDDVVAERVLKITVSSLPLILFKKERYVIGDVDVAVVLVPVVVVDVVEAVAPMLNEPVVA
jgi:hypothetical protein